MTGRQAGLGQENCSGLATADWYSFNFNKLINHTLKELGTSTYTSIHTTFKLGLCTCIVYIACICIRDNGGKLATVANSWTLWCTL